MQQIKESQLERAVCDCVAIDVSPDMCDDDCKMRRWNKQKKQAEQLCCKMVAGVITCCHSNVGATTATVSHRIDEQPIR